MADPISTAAAILAFISLPIKPIKWVIKRLRSVDLEKKNAEQEGAKWLERYKESLKGRLEKEKDSNRRQELADELERLEAAESIYYKKMMERTLERSGMPPYGELVALARDKEKPELAPTNEAKLKKAMHVLRELNKPGTELEYMSSATANYALERYNEALSDINNAIEIKANYQEAYNNRGIILSALGRHEKALADFNKSLEIKPDNPITLLNRGTTYTKLGHHEEALADYNKSLEIRPDHPSTLNNRGANYFKLGRFEEALADFNKSLEIRPDDPSTLSNRGTAYADLGRHEEALADYNKSLEIKPDDPSTLTNRGTAYADLGRHEEALADFNKSLEIRPNHPSTLYNLSCLYSLMNIPDDSISNLKAAIKLDEKYRKQAAEDNDFDNIRDDPRFKKLTENEE